MGTEFEVRFPIENLRFAYTVYVHVFTGVRQKDFTNHIIRDTNSFNLKNLRFLYTSPETH